MDRSSPPPSAEALSSTPPYAVGFQPGIPPRDYWQGAGAAPFSTPLPVPEVPQRDYHSSRDLEHLSFLQGCLIPFLLTMPTLVESTLQAWQKYIDFAVSIYRHLNTYFNNVSEFSEKSDLYKHQIPGLLLFCCRGSIQISSENIEGFLHLLRELPAEAICFECDGETVSDVGGAHQPTAWLAKYLESEHVSIKGGERRTYWTTVFKELQQKL